MDLAEVIAAHRVVVCVGSGGVGKTTISAAIAVDAALSGKRALCLTIDPARRLANSLGLTKLDHTVREIPRAHFEAQGLSPAGSLSAHMLDMKHTFDELVARYASTPEQRDRIFNNRIYQYVSTSLAGTQEYMAMEKLHEVRKQADYDLIVLDTPPTSNALDFLDAPQKLVGAIDSPAMRWFVGTLQGSQGLSLLGKSASFVLRGLARITGAEFLDMIAGFVTDLNELFGGFKTRAQAVYDDLRSDDVAFVVVTSPSPMAVHEAAFLTKKLADYGIEPKGVVVNRVHSPVEVPADPGALLADLQARAPELSEPRRLLDAMLEAARERSEEARHDRTGVDRMGEHVGEGHSYTEIPAFDGMVVDLAALSRVAACFGRSTSTLQSPLETP